VGFGAGTYTLHILLPLGVSFYTFQMLTYPLDIYRRQMSATRDPITFFAFASFFAQIAAGPIGRARLLLPQYERPRDFDDAQARDGLRQVLWGLTKKVLIADNLAPLVNHAFAAYSTFTSLNLVVAVFFFSMQLYCDFSGYSDLAIGVGKLLAIRLPINFAYPYFSRTIAEFWRRWHVSLSSWFRDYVYIPLGGSRVSRARHVFNVLVTFTLVGLWHGANWTFVVWGFLQGLYYVPLVIGRRKAPQGVVAEGRPLPTLREAGAVLLTFALVSFAWVFFRADSLAQAFGYLGRIVTAPIGTLDPQYVPYLLLCLVLLVVEWVQRGREFALQIGSFPLPLRWVNYTALLLVLLVFGSFGSRHFIYVQF
jgi:alginate O-acetyltransferase complex protein AlgI